jgi:hypothetical protein
MASFQEVESRLKTAATELFGTDPRVQAVGIGERDGEFRFRAVRNVRKILPLSARIGSPTEVAGIPVDYRDAPTDIRPAMKVPASGPGSPFASSFVPEQSHQRPLYCGLQIQNFDADMREGNIAQGFITIGTLGCFVRLPTGSVALLSNNHVVAAENDGLRGIDRILQPGTASAASVALEQIAFLTDFVMLNTSPVGASPAQGNVNFNVLDVGVAELLLNAQFSQHYLPFRNMPGITGTATAAAHDSVFKVGRTTGLTFGKVTSSSTIVGPVPYRPGPCWFERSIEIEGAGGSQFSDRGDSGSAIVKQSTGEVVGILYAGNGLQTYACPVGDALATLNCSLV